MKCQPEQQTTFMFSFQRLNIKIKDKKIIRNVPIGKTFLWDIWPVKKAMLLS